VLESRGRSILDHPLSRVMTTGVWVAFSKHDAAFSQRGSPASSASIMCLRFPDCSTDGMLISSPAASSPLRLALIYAASVDECGRRRRMSKRAVAPVGGTGQSGVSIAIAIPGELCRA
jgi:hypothetical protein